MQTSRRTASDGSATGGSRADRNDRGAGASRRSPLALERERARFATYKRTRDPQLRARLIEEHLPLARHLARRGRRGPEPLEDLIQVAAVGLVRAVDRYDPELGAAFASFAVPTILGEIKRHYRDRGWFVRVPRELQERAIAADRAAERLTTQHGHAPTVEEVARELGASVEDTLDARMASRAQYANSLDAPGRDGEDSAYERRLGQDDNGLERAEASADFHRLSKVLSERDREILLLRFRDGLTQREIGDRVGLSQMHVSRLIRAGLERLRAEAATDLHASSSPRG